ncbi:hypothetical protein HF673_02695 [Acidithiobacillus thiooxidans]|uniref:hypothetical protein n=1 Tax=Acidithiobacillus thiooxidans TaxID=930 RepID=UPI001C07A75F|nr:hypothetical protein [Acidithiobacillus thiooxidans]MBU2834716.1 hypothetical protein [Acidithiobacillus thiooxidans]
MKNYPLIATIQYNIQQYTKSLKMVQDQLPAVRRELRTWREGTGQYATAAAQKADLSSQIQKLKKQIAVSQRLLKNPEVIRRDRIVQDVEAIVTDMLPSFKNTPHDVYGGIGQNAEAYTDTDYDYDYYAKSYGHPKKIYSVMVTVNPDWDKTVRAQGLAYAGGMLTLSAKPTKAKKALRPALDLAATLGVDLFEASWMTQRRWGYQVHTEKGFIAVKRSKIGILSHTAYHAADPLKAVKGAYRKFQNVGDTLPLDSRNVPADAVATWADAKAVGACAPGVKSWCAAVGIDHTQDSVPLIDVVRGYYMRPMPEAKAIILRVLRQFPVMSAA